jgi:uncharacterized protein (TIGR03083 family)
LSRLVDSLSVEELSLPSYVDGWTIAQVLSHLGSAAEICAGLVRRGLDGSDVGPQREELLPIWDRWNALGPEEQRAQWREADRTHLDLLAAITAEQEATLRVPYFAGPMDLATYAGYRLSEHALHGWDVAVALDPAATVGHADLVWERIDLMATRFHDPAAREALAEQVVVLRHDGRHDRVEIGDALHVVAGAPSDPGDVSTTVSATTDVLTRVIYGRLRDSDALEIDGSVTRADLVRLFPGF